MKTPIVPPIAAVLLASFACAGTTPPSADAPQKIPPSEPKSSASQIAPVLRRDIGRLVAMRARLSIGNLEENLGEAFMKDRFLAAYRQAILANKKFDAPGKTLCPLAFRMVNGTLELFDIGDFDPQFVIAELDRLLAQTDYSAEKVYKEAGALDGTIWESYRPIILAREATKERDLLRMNATRPEVTVLPCGIQYETEPGKDSIRDINRCTREIGIAFFTRATTEIDFNRLPESVRKIADELPAASSWTFYVPYETEKAARNARQREARDLDARRRERLQKLLPGRIHEYKTDKPVETGDERRPLLRIKVWKDDPKAPVKVKPDVYRRDL